MHDQLARWDWVREAGIALSCHITTLTTEHEQSTVSGKIFRTLIPACFQRIRAGPRPLSPRCMPPFPPCCAGSWVRTRPGRYWAPSSPACVTITPRSVGWPWPRPLFRSTLSQTTTGSNNLCGKACARSFLASLAPAEVSFISFEPITPHDVPVGHSDTAPDSGRSVGPGTGTVGLGNPRNVAVLLSTCEKDVTQGICPAGLPDGIPPAGSKWALFPPHVPTINLADDGNPPGANLPETSTPIKTTPESGKRHSEET